MYQKIISLKISIMKFQIGAVKINTMGNAAKEENVSFMKWNSISRVALRCSSKFVKMYICPLVACLSR